MTENTNNENTKKGVLLEDLDHKLDLVLDGHAALDKKIDKVDYKVDDLKRDMNFKFGVVLDTLTIIRNELKEKVSRDEFALLEKRVAKLETKTER